MPSQPAPGLESGSGARATSPGSDERYVSDAYNSLSIEGYRVTDELIERVARGDWNPDGEPEHDTTRNRAGRSGLLPGLSGREGEHRQGAGGGERRCSSSSATTTTGTPSAAFRPSVTAGIVEASQLAGYRRGRCLHP
jgi:hypothetical protein